MNNKTDQTICLYIEPNVHVNVKGRDVLLYHTVTGAQLVYENRPAITGMLERMMSAKNLNAVIEPKTILEETELCEFLAQAKAMEMMNWYDYSRESGSHKKPVTLPPLLNFHRHRDKMALDPERAPGEDIIYYLHHLNIYINNHYGDTAANSLLKNAYKQFPFPNWAPQYKELPLKDIQRLIAQVKELKLCRVSILGGHIFDYSQWDGLMEYLTELPLKKEFGVFYKEFSHDRLERLNQHNLTDTLLKIFVEPDFDKDRLQECLRLTQAFNIPSNYQFTIQSESDAEDLEDVKEGFSDGELSVNPFYNGHNLEFFRNNIFIEQSDLSDPVVSKKEIYARSVMNPAAFGIITILSDGMVLSNPNEAPIGTIHHEVKQFLLKELEEGRGWFHLRREAKPCDDCIFQQVCPPLSNYEYALSRNDLCWRFSG